MTSTRTKYAVGLISVLFLTGMVMWLVPQEINAANAVTTISEGLDTAAEGTYSTDLKLTKFIGNMIRTLLAATGIVFLIITVYAGILYMIASGEPDKIKKAKSMLTNSVIGLIIIVGAYAITQYVIAALAKATTTT